jgi:hypothetical protein
MRGNVRGHHPPPSPFAARIGGWSVRHRRSAIIGWLLFVVAAAVVGGITGQTTMKPYENGAGDSARAERILAGAGIQHPAGEMVIVHSRAPNGWRAAATAVATQVRATGRIEHLLPAGECAVASACCAFWHTGTRCGTGSHRRIPAMTRRPPEARRCSEA